MSGKVIDSVRMAMCVHSLLQCLISYDCESIDSSVVEYVV